MASNEGACARGRGWHRNRRGRSECGRVPPCGAAGPCGIPPVATGWPAPGVRREALSPNPYTLSHRTWNRVFGLLLARIAVDAGLFGP